MVAKEFNISRDEMEEFAVISHQRAHEATTNGIVRVYQPVHNFSGYFRKEIVPITYTNKQTGEQIIHDRDEGIRYPIDRKKIAQLPTLSKGGRLTAAISRFVHC